MWHRMEMRTTVTDDKYRCGIKLGLYGCSKWKIPRIKRWNIADNIMTHLWPTHWEKATSCKKEERAEMCRDDRFIDILWCITYKHTPTQTKRNRYILLAELRCELILAHYSQQHNVSKVKTNVKNGTQSSSFFIIAHTC